MDNYQIFTATLLATGILSMFGIVIFLRRKIKQDEFESVSGDYRIIYSEECYGEKLKSFSIETSYSIHPLTNLTYAKKQLVLVMTPDEWLLEGRREDSDISKQVNTFKHFAPQIWNDIENNKYPEFSVLYNSDV